MSDNELARGVETNGIGLVTTSHLNLTVTLADADRDDFIRHAKARSGRVPRPEAKGVAYAGKAR